MRFLGTLPILDTCANLCFLGTFPVLDTSAYLRFIGILTARPPDRTSNLIGPMKNRKSAFGLPQPLAWERISVYVIKVPPLAVTSVSTTVF